LRFERLEISYFRNLSNVVVELGPGLNYFFGDNGAGKTAMLEATHLLCRSRSFRTKSARSLIQRDADMLVVRALAVDELRGPLTLAMSKDRQARTVLKVDGERERRLSEAARLTPLQVMLPDIAELVFGQPGLRRHWLDWGTFHVKPEYLVTLREYLRILRQRNAALKSASPLPPWTAKLLVAAEAVTELRRQFLADLAPHFQQAIAALAPELQVSLHFQQGWPQLESLQKLLGDSAAREVKLGATQWGPHRADVELRLGATRASTLLSRGQGKMVASALKISQAAMLAQQTQRATVFLIDDVGAELDTGHSGRFFALLQDLGCQILATSTQPPTAELAKVVKKLHRFHVERGEVRVVGG
jgi:DNA replication and repair protein RecF